MAWMRLGGDLWSSEMLFDLWSMYLQPIEYSGGRSIEELVEFVNEQIDNNKMSEEQRSELWL